MRRRAHKLLFNALVGVGVSMAVTSAASAQSSTGSAAGGGAGASGASGGTKSPQPTGMGVNGQLGIPGANAQSGRSAANGQFRRAGTVFGPLGPFNVPYGAIQYGYGPYGYSPFGYGQYGYRQDGMPSDNAQFVAPNGNAQDRTRFGNAPRGTPLKALQNATLALPGPYGDSNSNKGADGQNGDGGNRGGYGLVVGDMARAATDPSTVTNPSTDALGTFGGIYGGVYGYIYGQNAAHKGTPISRGIR